MTNATKSLAVVFIVLLVVTVAMKWSSGPEASQAFRSELVSVDTAAVKKMVINHPLNPTVTLKKDNGGWNVTGQKPEIYPADARSVENAISRLNNLSVNSVATRQPDKYTRYKVDSTGIKVSLYDGEEQLQSIYVGGMQRAGRRSINNYVRLADENAVYVVEGFLKSTFSKGINDWRDKQIWDLEQSNISRVNFLYPADSSFTIRKVKGKQWVSAGDTLSQTSVSTTLSRLANFRASGFADSLSVDDFGKEKYAVQLELTGGERRRFRLRESPADTTIYLGVTERYPYVFTLRKSTWDDYVLKSREELLRNTD